MKQLIYFFTLIFIFLFSEKTFGTHNRAGEITYVHLTGNTYQATITTYTKIPTNANRHSLILYWGDGDSSSVIKIDSVKICDSISRNHYIGTHTYVGIGTYILCLYDPNRIQAICNIANPVNVAFSLNSEISMPDPQFLGYNSSAIFYNSPIVYGHIGTPLIYNGNGSDPDGDSLVYKFETPYINCGVQLSTGAFTQPVGMTINPTNGEINWPSPPSCCNYNIAYRVYEYRKNGNGKAIPVGNVLRDMQIIITCNPNHTPQIAPIAPICVWAGNPCQFTVNATDADNGQWINLSANGIPFTNQVTNPASFTSSPSFLSATANFNWQTSCNDLKAFPYQVVVKATDSIVGQGSCSDLVLSTNLTVKITVIPPPPLNLVATQVANHVHLSWNNYVCAGNPKFRYFTIWRKIGCDNLQLDSCQQGMAGLGYTQIATNVTTNFYDDNNVVRGQQYAYRVEAEFYDLSVSGYIYNHFSGHPSDEACIALKMDIPVLVNVSVTNTDAALGSIFVRWTRPHAVDLDTILNPPPYIFKLWRDVNPTSHGTLVTTKTFNSFHQIQNATDTSFTETGLNTVQNQYYYSISLLAQGGADSIGISNPASSVYLSPNVSSHTVSLAWLEFVPWVNDTFVVFQKNNVTLLFNPIATVTTHQFDVKHLQNGTQYCFYVQTKGHFTANYLPPFTINLSQQVCAIPIDTVASCPPSLTITNPCSNDASTLYNELKNHLTWTNPNSSCADDVVKYFIYYSPTQDGNLILIDSIKPAASITFDHSSIDSSVAGCYAVTAIDSFYNESLKSNIVCMDNCPLYVLPNTFTPNGDGSNDVFHPFIPYRFISKVDMKIYNRWGNLVFKTDVPYIGWDGKDLNGKELGTGTFYYVCDVYEIRVGGVTKIKKPLSGFIELIR